MPPITLDFLCKQFELAEQLRLGKESMLEPQDLPGRYGRVIQAVDGLLTAIRCESVIGGGWAVWRHGYVGRITQDVDIVLPKARIEEFLRVAAVSGFQILPVAPGRWPKVLHTKTDVKVDILPEGERPGTVSKPAPTTIGHPAKMGASGTILRYIELPSLIELKLAAGRGQDDADVIKLVAANADQVDTVRQHLSQVHASYVTAFDHLVQRARDEDEQDG